MNDQSRMRVDRDQFVLITSLQNHVESSDEYKEFLRHMYAQMMSIVAAAAAE